MKLNQQNGTIPFMTRLVDNWDLAYIRLGSVILAGLTGLLGVAALAQVGQVTAKKAAAVVLLAAICGIAYVTKRLKEVFLFFFIFSLTYNRQYFFLQDSLGNPGTQGPYFVAADFFFLGLLGLWAYERVFLKRTAIPKGDALWPWYLPFVLACVFSLMVAAHVDWGAFELIRVAKVGLILWYARYNLDRRMWWRSIMGLGAALSIQSILGTLEVAFHHSGVLWIFGLGSQEEILPQALEAESFYGWTRAQATMNHPPNLACYLLLCVPVFVALAITHRERKWRMLCTLIAIFGVVGLACTLSRWPIVLMAVLLLALLVGLTALRVIDVRHTLALMSVGVLLVAGTGLAFSDFIANRVSRDFDASVDQRLDGYRAAYHMYLRGNPLLGVGLNNYRAYMLNFQPELEWIDKYEGLALEMNIRFPAAPQNSFLFVLAETGFLGLLGFVIYVAGGIRAGVRGIAATRSHYRAATFALLIGLIGVMLQQSIDHSYWVDPLLYSTALVIGMMNNARSLCDDEVSG